MPETRQEVQHTHPSVVNFRLVQFSPAKNSKELKRFVSLPWSIYKNQANWIPPLRLKVLEDLDTKKNPFYCHASIQLWNAYDGKEHVGRIAAVKDERYNEIHKKEMAFFGFFESVDRTEVAEALFTAVESWAKQQNLSAVQGPVNPSLNHAAGLQINAFEREPYIMTTQNPPYYEKLLTHCSYQKAKDLFCHEFDFENDDIPAITKKICERIRRKNKVTIRCIDKKNLKQDIKYIQDIYNDAWEDNWGFVPLDDHEFDFMAKGMKDILWSNFCLLAMVNGEHMAMVLSLPDIHQVQKKIPNGKLLPFGIFKLLSNLWRPNSGCINQTRQLIIGIKSKYRSTGVLTLLAYEIYQRSINSNIRRSEVGWILENNHLANKTVEQYTRKPPYKTYRIYEKTL